MWFLQLSSCYCRGRELNPNIFFLKLFGRFRDIPAKSQDIPPKKFDFPGFEGHTEFFDPHPLKWKTPTPPEDSRTKKAWVWVLFSCLILGTHEMFALQELVLLPRTTPGHVPSS